MKFKNKKQTYHKEKDYFYKKIAFLRKQVICKEILWYTALFLRNITVKVYEDKVCYGIYIRAMTNEANGIPSQLSDNRNQRVYCPSHWSHSLSLCNVVAYVVRYNSYATALVTWVTTLMKTMNIRFSRNLANWRNSETKSNFNSVELSARNTNRLRTIIS